MATSTPVIARGAGLRTTDERRRLAAEASASASPKTAAKQNSTKSGKKKTAGEKEKIDANKQLAAKMATATTIDYGK